MHLQANFPIMNWTIRVHVNIDFGGYVEVNSLYFLFMEQMHWQFISYSCSLPSGIHLYKLERYTRCLPFSYAWLSYGHHNHNHNPIYTVWSSQHAFEEENSNYPQFPRAKGGLGYLSWLSHVSRSSSWLSESQTNYVICSTSVILCARVCNICC